ncbi:Cof-type HAD-IIB family hydrolase [Fusobacterium sp. IOR10]|uniref:Cof-type HAD-IIB family hydrolase n=1 Tax=Fusobacterium sp. IOR10 TaxID=2665157 RepID=UPI0013D6205D|nr:Cof-type HAD-IIB family hydrolase [Fusobacterium sp. IOR10]
MYKAVISDLDGTLLNSNHEISDYSKEIIGKIIKKGVKFIIATGRHHKDAMCFKNQLGADSFLVSANGAVVHDYKNKVIMNYTIPKDYAEYFLNLTLEENIMQNVYTFDKWYVNIDVPEVNEYHKESGFTPDIVNLTELKKDNISKFAYICRDSNVLEELENKLKNDNTIANKINITASLDICLEIMKKGVSKGKSISEILEKEGISLEETIAFGDGLNDKEMLELVGKGLVMGNASEKLKKALPNNEVIGTSDEDSEARYLKKIFL